MIYIITDVDRRWCKIGFSNKPKQRMADIQVGMPVTLELIKVIAGTRVEEKELHKKFKNHWIRGEWFKWHSDISDFLNSQKQVEPPSDKKKDTKLLSAHKYNSTNPLLNSAVSEYDLRILTASERALLRYICKNKKNEKINLASENGSSLPRTTIYRMVLRLIDKSILAKADMKGLYFVNPSVSLRSDQFYAQSKNGTE